MDRDAQWSGKKTLFEPAESFRATPGKEEWNAADHSVMEEDDDASLFVAADDRPSQSFPDFAASITSTWYDASPRELCWTKKDYKSVSSSKKKKKQKHPQEDALREVPPELVDVQLERAKRLYEADAELYEKKRSKTSNSKWIRTVLKSGTHADKLAAMVLIVQEDPLHSMKTLNILVSLAQKKGKAQSLMACDTLKDLFIHNLLPDRHLKFFRDQPLSHPRVTDEHLKHWYFEGAIKELFLDFLRAMESVLADTVVRIKNAALTYVSELLCAKPEQERVLLNLLIHKLGDSTKKSSSKAVYLLHKVVEAHPNMVETIANEVERFIHRTGVTDRARYCALIFLNETKFSEGDVELARRFVEIYFDVFKIYVGQRNIDTKIMSALLTGVNRAFPYGPAATTDPIYNEHLDALFKIIHISSFNKSIQALQLVYQVLNDQLDLNDRYFTALYSRLMSSEIRQTTKLSAFLNILFKSMRQDSNDSRTAAFVKRLLQVGLSQPPRLTCAILFMLSELFKNKPQLRNLVSGAATGARASMDIKLKVERIVEKAEPLPDDSQDEEESSSSESSMDEEGDSQNWRDQYDSSEEELVLPQHMAIGGASGAGGGGKRAPKKARNGGKSNRVKKEPSTQEDGKPWQTEYYDPFKRQPQYANAENTILYELCLLSHHRHPSVVVWSKALLRGESISYNGNPLEDFTLAAFLDKFCYRKPKTKKAERSVFAPPASAEARWKHEPLITSEAFLNQKEVSPDQVFFYKYFNEKTKGDKKVKSEKAQQQQQEEETVVLLDEDEVDKILDGAFGGDDEEFDYDMLDEFEESSETVPGDGGAVGNSRSSKGRKPAWSEEMFDETIFDDIDPNDPDVFQAGGAMQRLLDKSVKTPGEKKYSAWAKGKNRGGSKRDRPRGKTGKAKKSRGTRGASVKPKRKRKRAR